MYICGLSYIERPGWATLPTQVGYIADLGRQRCPPRSFKIEVRIFINHSADFYKSFSSRLCIFQPSITDNQAFVYFTI